MGVDVNVLVGCVGITMKNYMSPGPFLSTWPSQEQQKKRKNTTNRKNTPEKVVAATHHLLQLVDLDVPAPLSLLSRCHLVLHVRQMDFEPTR